jgi:hypothetical protein
MDRVSKREGINNSFFSKPLIQRSCHMILPARRSGKMIPIARDGWPLRFYLFTSAAPALQETSS